jgi:transposase InsO family protein
MDLGSQDCIIGVKWLRQFRLQLDPYRNRLLWPTEYPSTYDASPPILMTLAQPKYHRTVELDIARRDALWEQDEARRNQSPTIHRIRGLLKIPKPRSVAPSPVKSVEVPVQPRSVVHPRIALISANGLHFNMKRKENEFFTTTLYEIDRVLEDKHFLEDDPDNLDLLRARLPPVYQAYQDVFSKAAADQLPKHQFYDHKIVLTEPLPNAYSALYKQSVEELEATKKYLQDNLEKGFIEHSRSPFASPILCVRKANGDLRVCVDYRKLNAITRKDAYPIPRIDELLSRPAKAKFFTKFDIRAAFNRIRMDPGSEEYTTFRTRYGTYKCKVLPFGLCNGPATYQRYMNDVLIDYLDDFCIAYLDDILVYSEDEVTHTLHVKKVLERLRQAGLHVDIKKSEFHVNRTRYLGYILTSQGLEVDPGKVSVLRDWMPPTTVTGVKSFLGFAGFYRQFVPEFSRIAKPLIMLQSPARPFVWDSDCQQAFDQVREALLAIPTLFHFHSERDTRLETDASDGVIAGVFSQKHPDGKWCPVAFYSHCLTGSELNWEIHDKELFAIVTAFAKWKAELASVRNQIEVLSDHRSLEYFMTTKVLNSRQVRWAEDLACFNFRITYTPGKDNARADILSRREQDMENLRTAQVDNRSRVLLGPHRLHPRINAELATAYIAHTTIQVVRLSVLESVEKAMSLDSLQLVEALLQENRTSFIQERAVLPKQYRMQDGLLLFGDRLCVAANSPLCTRLIREVHDQVSTAHPSATKTYQLLAQKYHWKGMEATCKRYVRNCSACRRAHPRQTRIPGLIHPLPIPERPMQHLCIDFKEFPKDKSGYDSIMVIIDRLSKQAISIPCHKTIDARGMAELFVQWVYRFGHTPETIISDRGPQFVSRFWSEFCRILGIKVKLSTAYHKETDGQTEIMNKYIDQRLRPFVTFYQDNWSGLLPLIDRAQISLPHSAIGMSPYRILYGSEPRQSWDWQTTSNHHTITDKVNYKDALALATRMHDAWKVAKTNMEKAQNRMRSVINRHRRQVDWSVGDMVYLDTQNLSSARPSRKLSDKWTGPFKVIEQVGNSYRLELPSGSRIHDVFAPNLLCKDPQDPLPGQEPPKPPGTPINGVEEWEVEEILASKLTRSTLKYRVKWVGHDPDPVWYKASNFMGSPYKLREYHESYPNRPGPPRSLDKWIEAWKKGMEDMDHLEDDRVN